MDVEELRKKLHPKEEKEKQFKAKISKYSTVIKIGIGTVLVIILFAAFAAIQTPEKIEGAQKACFKGDICLDLMIMQTPEELEIGLSNHTSMPADTAMLFIFDKPGVQRMWMKDMDFPIDIFWISSTGKIVHIEKNALPCEGNLCEIFEPQTLTKYVIETRLGFAKEYALFDGHKVRFENIPKS